MKSSKRRKEITILSKQGISPMTKGFTKIGIDKLVKASWNYKLDDEMLAKKLEANIKKNGQIENLIVRELEDKTFEVVNGNHRFDALVRLGMLEVFAFNLGKISDADAKLLAIETNETKFAADWNRLSGLMIDIANSYSIGDLMETLPYSQKEIDRFLKIANDEFTQVYENNEVDLSQEEQFKLVITFTNEQDFLDCQRAVNNLQPTPAIGLKALLDV